MLLVALLLVGCQTGEDAASPPTPTTTASSPTETPTPTDSPTSTATPTPTGTASGATTDWVTCDNDREGYTVRHPPDWKTNAGDVLPPCSLFDPADVEVERGTEIPFDIAVTFRVEPVELARVARGGRAEEELDREEATVEGRDAVRREVESTGEALRPAGLRSTLWLVSITDDETLVAVTHDAGELEYAEKQEVLDQMVNSLELHEE